MLKFTIVGAALVLGISLGALSTSAVAVPYDESINGEISSLDGTPTDVDLIAGMPVTTVIGNVNAFDPDYDYILFRNIDTGKQVFTIDWSADFEVNPGVNLYQASDAIGSVTDFDFALGTSGQFMLMTNSGFSGGDVTLSVLVDGGSISYTVSVPRPTAAPIPASLLLLGPVLATLGVARVTNRRTGWPRR